MNTKLLALHVAYSRLPWHLPWFWSCRYFAPRR